jgi:hypothetical protein
MTSKLEKGGGSFTGIKLLLCENPLPPLGVVLLRRWTDELAAGLRPLSLDREGAPVNGPHRTVRKSHRALRALVRAA